MSKEEMIMVLQGITEFNNLDKEDKEAFDWLDEATRHIASKEDVFNSILKTVEHWSFYLVHCEKKEDFESCALIKNAIEIEIEDIRRVINTYFIFTDNDERRLKDMALEEREAMNINYKDYLKLEQKNDK